MPELDSHSPSSIACGGHVYYAEILFLPRISVLNPNGLPFFNHDGQMNQALFSEEPVASYS
jgi:hypothetical protein